MNVQNLKMHFNNNGNQNSEEDRKQSPGLRRTHIPIAQFPMRNSSNNLNSVNSSPSFLLPSNKWRNKFEEAEKKRKTLLTENEKLIMEHDYLNQKCEMLQNDIDTMKSMFSDKETELEQLRKLSEGVYNEYDQLRIRYELESGTMEQVVKKASQWYIQNRELKRRSTALLQRVMEVAPGSISELNDETDNSTNTDEFDELRIAVKGLQHQVACLQADLNRAVQQEFEAQEKIIELTSVIDNEKEMRVRTESELKELKAMYQNWGQVHRMVETEVSSLREQCTKEKEVAQRMKSNADKAIKERNVLAHQSQLLMCEIASDERIVQLLTEIENLKRMLEDQQQEHVTQIQQLQEKLEERENEVEESRLKVRLDLAESQLLWLLERTERAETFNFQLTNEVSKLESELESFRQNSASAPSTSVPPPPPPPPPPPLPPAAFVFAAPKPKDHDAQRSDPNCEGAEPNSVNTGSAVYEMANLLGIPRKTARPPVQTVAIDDIINEIKGGRFTLKATEKKLKVNKVEEQPPVVQEMISVLGTLRRRGNPSFRKKKDIPPADVAL